MNYLLSILADHNVLDDWIRKRISTPTGGSLTMFRALLGRYEQVLSRAPTATTGVVAAGLGVSE